MEVYTGKPLSPVRFFSQWLLLWPDGSPRMGFPTVLVQIGIGRCLGSGLQRPDSLGAAISCCYRGIMALLLSPPNPQGPSPSPFPPRTLSHTPASSDRHRPLTAYECLKGL